MSLTRAVRYESMYSFKYSPRPNTLALKRYPDDVTDAEKTRRIVALQALQREIQIEMHEAEVGLERGRAGRFGEPPARLGALGPHVRQHRRQFSRARASGLGGPFPCASRAPARTASPASALQLDTAGVEA